MAHDQKELLKLAYKKQILSSEQVRHCLKVQSDYQKKGVSVSTSQLLIKFGFMTMEQIAILEKQILKSQKKVSSDLENFSISHDYKTSSLSIFGLGKGVVVGGYEIEEEIGRGGMGVVYRASHPNQRGVVALKLIILNLSVESSKKGERFLREAKISAKLSHPNIIKVYNAGQEGNIFYLVMEYVKGSSIDDYLQTKEFSLEQKMLLLEKIAQALNYAHERGIVHRDIKPANIMVRENGEPLLMDFGLAKSFTIEDKSITKTGEMLGTPRYMAPEQLMGKSRLIDQRTDIYALGAVLYEIITGRHMISGNTPMEILYNINYECPIPPSKVHSTIPRDLENIWWKATDPIKERRYESARNLANDLSNFIQGKRVLARKPMIPGFALNLWKKRFFQVTIITILTSIALLGSILFYSYYKEKQNLSLPRVFTKLSNIEPQTVQEYLLYAEGLMRQGFFEESQKNLNQALVLDNPSPSNNLTQRIHQKSVVALVALKKYKEALTHYLQLSSENQAKEEVALSTGKAYFFLRSHRQSQECLEKLLAKKLIPSSIKAQALYYQGLIFQDQNKRHLARQAFLQSEKTLGKVNENHFSHSYYPMLLFHLGKEFFEEKNLFLARRYFEKAQPLLASWPRVYEYLGRCFWEKDSFFEDEESLEKAFYYFEKCLELDPSNVQYQTLYAQVAQSLKKYDLASQFFQKALNLDPGNLDALQGFLTLGLKMLSSQQHRFHLLLHYLNQAKKVKAPDLFLSSFQDLQNTYQNSYFQWKTLSENTKGDPDVFLQLLCQENSSAINEGAAQGLLALRYHIDTEEKIKTILEQNKKNSLIYDRVEKAWELIQKEKNREAKQALYYQISRLHLQKDVLSQKKLKKNFPKPLLLEILDDENENVYFRYLAGKTLLRLLYFRALELRTKSRDINLAIISTAVFREAQIPCPHPAKTLQQNISSLDHPFLQSLLAKTIGFSNIPFLLPLLKSKDERVQMYAAANGISFPNNALVYEQSKEILLEMMEHKKALFRQYAHSKFWRIYFRNTGAEAYGERFRKALEDPSVKVQEAALAQYDCINTATYKTKLVDIIQNPPSSKAQFLAIVNISYYSPEHPILQNIIFNLKYPFFTRLFSLTSSMFTRSHRRRRDIDFFSNLMKKAKIFEELTSAPGSEFRASIYYMRALLGSYPFENLKKEQDQDVIAHILASSRIRSFGFPILAHILPNTHTKEERASMTQGYLYHPYPRIREGAAAAQVSLSEISEQNALYQRIRKSSDLAWHQGTALGFYSNVYFSILNQMNIDEIFEVTSLETTQDRYIERFRFQAKISQNRAQYKTWLSYAINLSQVHEYFYERAILHQADQKWETALNDLNQALELSPQTPRYLIEKAKILWTTKRYHEIAPCLEDAFAPPYNLSVLKDLGELWLKLYDQNKEEHSLKQASEIFRQIYLLQPIDGLSNLGWIRALMRSDQEQRARKYLRYLGHYTLISRDILQQYPELHPLTKD